MNLLIYTPQMALYGGMERHLCLLATACARVGHRVALVTTSNSLNDKDRQMLIQSGVAFYELPLAREKAPVVFKLIWLVLVSLWLRRIRWQVIYTNGQSGLARFVWWAGRSGTRIVHHHHTAASEDEIASWHPAFRRVLQRVPELIACSRATKHQLEKTLQRDDVVFLPYLTPEIMPGSAVPASKARSDSILHFGYIGRLVSTKGIEEICQLSLRPNLGSVRWHLYGESDDYPLEYFLKFPNIYYHGRYKNLEHYASILTGLDAVVLLSRHAEGMPLSLIEAMSAGLPWIATDRGGTSEMGLAKENFIVIPADTSISEMEGMVVEMVMRISSGQTSRVAQRSAYDSHFSPPVVAEKWLRFFTAD